MQRKASIKTCERSRYSYWAYGVFGTLLACLVLAAITSRRGPSPPKFGRCTRLEVEYFPSVLEHLVTLPSELGLLTVSERQYLQSRKTFAIYDRLWIRAFARELRAGSYRGVVAEEPQSTKRIRVRCYRDGQPHVFFAIYGDSEFIVTDAGCRFDYSGPLPWIAAEIPELRPFVLRMGCGNNLLVLHRFSDRVRAYMTPSTWCDVVRKRRPMAGRPGYHVPIPAQYLQCDSAGGGDCHYAMNPDCALHSPPDTVLFFETKAGWNQHGGPELFTFDNHSPPGGCVLLNDGTVKFIRTEEELNQLRWR